jgi:ribosomal protein S3
MGRIGVKVWINRGEILPVRKEPELEAEAADSPLFERREESESNATAETSEA